MPELGFDIGQKAIKINRNVANKIIKEWPSLKKEFEKQKLQKEEESEEKQIKVEAKRAISIPNFITVRELSQIAGLPVNAILSILMKNGIFASLNEKIDFETAWLIGSELNIEVKLKKSEKEEVDEKIIRIRGT